MNLLKSDSSLCLVEMTIATLQGIHRLAKVGSCPVKCRTLNKGINAATRIASEVQINLAKIEVLSTPIVNLHASAISLYIFIYTVYIYIICKPSKS